MTNQNSDKATTTMPRGIIKSARDSVPLVSIESKRLIGHILQTALSRDQLGGPTRLIPPLKVVTFSCASGDPQDRYGADTYFIGEPLRPFLLSEEFREDFSYISKDTLFMFFSNIDEIQPQFCLDPQFLAYLQGEGESVPVEVYTISRKAVPDSPGFASSVENYNYLDFGVAQLFVPGRGFVSQWPDSYPRKKELKRIEHLLIQNRGLGRK